MIRRSGHPLTPPNGVPAILSAQALLAAQQATATQQAVTAQLTAQQAMAQQAAAQAAHDAAAAQAAHAASSSSSRQQLSLLLSSKLLSKQPQWRQLSIKAATLIRISQVLFWLNQCAAQLVLMPEVGAHLEFRFNSSL